MATKKTNLEKVKGKHYGIAVVGRAVMHYKPNRKGGHTHNHIYNVLYRSTFHKGPRSVGVMKPYYRRVLLKSIEQFGYGVSKGRLILH